MDVECAGQQLPVQIFDLHNYTKRMAIFFQCHLVSRKAFDFLVSVLFLPVGKIKTVRSNGYNDGSITSQ